VLDSIIEFGEFGISALRHPLTRKSNFFLSLDKQRVEFGFFHWATGTIFARQPAGGLEGMKRDSQHSAAALKPVEVWRGGSHEQI
jgi:hypothetical protein